MAEPEMLEVLSEKLTPVEIKNKEFKRTVWGYSPHEVVAFLDLTAKTWEGVQRQEREIRETIQKLMKELTGWKQREEELQKIHESAIADAEQIRNAATEEAKTSLAAAKERVLELRARTEEWLEQVISEVEETEKQRQSLKTALKENLDRHYSLLQSKLEDGPLGDRLTHFLSSIQSTGSHSAVPGK